MTSLTEVFSSKLPLSWIVSSDPFLVLDTILSFCPDDAFYYMQDGKLCCQHEGHPVPVLVTFTDPESGEEVQEPITDPAAALIEVLERKGTYFLPQAETMFDGMLKGFFVGRVLQVAQQWRECLLKDDLELHPGQLVFTSYSEEVPDAIANFMSVVDNQYPDFETLANTLSTVYSKNKNIFEDPSDIREVAQAAVGMTEFQLLHQVTTSYRSNGRVQKSSLVNAKTEAIRNGGVLEFKRPSITFDEIGGLDNIKEIIETARWMHENPQKLAEMDIQPIRRILMVGVPGTGKSAICEATAQALGYDLAKFGVSKMMSKWVGQSEQNMRSAFAQMRAMSSVSGLVAWVDEFGRDATEGHGGDSGTTTRVHAELLTGLQELPDNVFLMAAANDISNIAPELMRADRFDSIVFVGFPTMNERIQILKIHLGSNAEHIDVTEVARVTPMFTGAEIKSLIKETTFKYCMRQGKKLDTQMLIEGARTSKNRIWIRNPNMVAGLYKVALEQWEWASTSQRQEAEIIASGNGSSAPSASGSSSPKQSITL